LSSSTRIRRSVGCVSCSAHKLNAYKNEDMWMTERWIPNTKILFEDDAVSIYEDGYPVTEGHALVVPRINSTHYIDEALKTAFWWGRKLVAEGECDAFNVGMNYGRESGQTIYWPHVHIIPRRKGDTDDPRGGVRHVIQGKGNYLCNTL